MLRRPTASPRDLARGDPHGSGALPAGEQKHSHRDRELLLDLVQQPPLLPPGSIVATEADQEVIWSEVANGVLERQERIVGSDAPMGRAARLVQLAEDGT